MTIVSTSGKASPSFPPVDDAITVKNIDWADVRARAATVYITVVWLSPSLARSFNLGVISLRFDMSLPMDPAECPWTPEGQAYEEERARRAYQARLAAMENR